VRAFNLEAAGVTERRPSYNPSAIDCDEGTGMTKHAEMADTILEYAA